MDDPIETVHNENHILGDPIETKPEPSLPDMMKLFHQIQRVIHLKMYPLFPLIIFHSHLVTDRHIV